MTPASPRRSYATSPDRSNCPRSTLALTQPFSRWTHALVSGGAFFLRRLLTDRLLANATSEKGGFVTGQAEFSDGSVFRAVVDSVAREDVLICDDLGDEWADFIGVTADVRQSMISFYHAKHGDRSLSASAFHDAVGQAIKNLGRLGLTGNAA